MKLRSKQMFRWFLYSLPLALVILGAGYYAWLLNSIESLTPIVNMTISRLNDLKESAKETDRIRKELVILQQKTDVIDALRNRAIPMDSVEETLAACTEMPPEVIRILTPGTSETSFQLSLVYTGISDQTLDQLLDMFMSLPQVSTSRQVDPGPDVSPAGMVEILLTLSHEKTASL